MNKKYKHIDIITKPIVAILIAALLVTNAPEFFTKKIVAAESTWKILEERDLPVDELYGWYPYDSADQLMIGRKDGKIAFLDSSLKLVKKTEYDLLEEDGVMDGTDYNLLVSRPMRSGSEYAIVDKTGKVTVLGTYKKAESLGLVGKPILYAEKVNGECGFVVNGKAIGFDKKFVDKTEEAVVEYNIVTIAGKTYYVKNYFETEDICYEVGGICEGISIEEMKKVIQAERYEFIIYDETGAVVDVDSLIREYEKKAEDEEKQKEEDARVIPELEQTAASQLPVQEYLRNTCSTSTGEYTVSDVTAYRFGEGYLAYVKADVEFLFEGDRYKDPYYFAGFFDKEKNLVKFGEVIAARDEDYWDEGIYLTIRDNDKKIYFYGDDDYANTGNMVKYLYTDTEDAFTGGGYELGTAYPHCVVLGGYGENGFIYLVASPMNDFVKTTSMYTRLYEKNTLKAEYALLNEENGKREAVFYDSNWNVIKSMDVSHVNGDIELCDGVVLGRSCVLLYKTQSGYYGLVGMDGNIVADVEKERYTYGSVQSSYFGKTCVYFERDDVRYYYYEDNLIPHTEEEYDSWGEDDDEEGDDGIKYGDITYSSEETYDDNNEVVSVSEKVADRFGNVLASHEVSGETYKREERKPFIYVFPDCKSIVVVDRHWNGKRGDDLEDGTPKPTMAPTDAPEVPPTEKPSRTQAPPVPPMPSTGVPTDAPGVPPTERPDETEIPSLAPTDGPAGQPPVAPGSSSLPVQPPSQIILPSNPIPVPTPDRSAEEDADDDEEEDKQEKEEDKLQKGDYIMMGKLGYKITKLKGKKGEAAVVVSVANKAKSIVIPKNIKKDGITLTVTSIQKNALMGYKKAKTLNIKSTGIKSIAKKALSGLSRWIQIKVPKSKVILYRKLLKKCGCGVIRQ